MPSGSTAAGSRSRPGCRCGTGPRSCPQLNESRIGLFGIAGFARALVATRSGRWANARRAAPVSGLALVLLILWAAIAQLPWSLWLLFAGIVVLDFALQAAHVSNQHVLTSTYPDRVSSVIGGCMVFYSLGAAAATTTSTTYGWAGSSLLGGAFVACAPVVWATDRGLPRGSVGPASEQAGPRLGRDVAVGRVMDRSEVPMTRKRAACTPTRPYWPDHEAAIIALRRRTTAATETATGDV